ncbi:MAG: transglutaminase domain-containing protein [Lachnospiraceae bacterium]|nr:transglutaminase domain-containing protein [Lachnospiraceae bacterium]
MKKYGYKMGNGLKCFALLFTLMFAVLFPAHVEAKKTVPAKLSKKTVTVGNQVSVKTSLKGVKFVSSNTVVASVSSDGVITGKKAGNVQIQVKRSGYKTAVCKLTVKKKERGPELPVSLDEVEQRQIKMTKSSNGTPKYQASIKNKAKKGKIRKIEYHYEIQSEVKQPASVATPEPTDTPDVTPSPTPAGDDTTTDPSLSESESEEATETTIKKEKKTVVLTASNIKPGKSVKATCEGDASGNISAMHLKEVKLYTGEALYIYNVKTKKSSLKWGVPDKKAPVFSGWVGKKSYYGKDILRVCYSDRKNSYKFTDNVRAVDARDGKVKITVDTGKINWNKTGVYKVYYHAKDKSGNKATAWAKVQMYVKSTPETIADEVLSDIIRKGWSQEKKLRAIYKYVSTHCSYVDKKTHKNWRKTAVNGIRYESGDCFTYYSISRLLISRAGIPNLEITRYPVRSAHHWWNLVYVRGGWYHFDTTPRQRKGYFCLQTDAQLRIYSTGNTFSFQSKKFPKRATKKISKNPI